MELVKRRAAPRWAVRVKTHFFQGTSTVIAQFLLQIQNKKMRNIRSGAFRWQISKSIKVITQFVYLENWIKVVKYNIRWGISTSLKVIACMFTPALTVLKTIKFEMFDLYNLDQGNGVQHSPWCYSVAYINVYNSRNLHFCTSSHLVQDIKVPNIWPCKLSSRSQSTIVVMSFCVDFQAL